MARKRKAHDASPAQRSSSPKGAKTRHCGSSGNPPLDRAAGECRARPYRLEWPSIHHQARLHRTRVGQQLQQLPPVEQAACARYYRPSRARVVAERTTPASPAPPALPRNSARLFTPYREPRLSSLCVSRDGGGVEATKARLRQCGIFGSGHAARGSSSDGASSSDAESDADVVQKPIPRGSFHESWAQELAVAEEPDLLPPAAAFGPVADADPHAVPHPAPSPPPAPDDANPAGPSDDTPSDRLGLRQHPGPHHSESGHASPRDDGEPLAHEREHGDDAESERHREHALSSPHDNHHAISNAPPARGRVEGAWQGSLSELQHAPPEPLVPPPSAEPPAEDEAPHDEHAVSSPHHTHHTLSNAPPARERVESAWQGSLSELQHAPPEPLVPPLSAERPSEDEVPHDSHVESVAERIDRLRPSPGKPEPPTLASTCTHITGAIQTPADIRVERTGSAPSSLVANSIRLGPEPAQQGSSGRGNPETRKSSDAGAESADGVEVAPDTQDLYHDIDHLIQDLFQSTRPLPEGKPTLTQTSSSQHQVDHSLTSVSSNLGQCASHPCIAEAKSADGSLASSPANARSHSDSDSHHNLGEEAHARLDTDNHDKLDRDAEFTSRMYDSDGDEIELDDDERGNERAQSLTGSGRSSNFTDLSPTASPSAELSLPPQLQQAIAVANGASTPVASASSKKRQMTGRTSKHFFPPHNIHEPYKTYDRVPDRIAYVCLGPRVTRSRKSEEQQPHQLAASAQSSNQLQDPHERKTLEHEHTASRSSGASNRDSSEASDGTRGTQAGSSAKKLRAPSKKRKTTGAVSEHFITDRVDKYNASGRRRVVGVSYAPVPSTKEKDFGLIQEKIWAEPFWLIIAVTFLNKTAGRSAVPVFWKIRQRWPRPDLLARADSDELLEMIQHLGLQNQRRERIQQIAHAWVSCPPVSGKRFRILNYPNKGDGKGHKGGVLEGDTRDCAGAVELAHIPGCGRYAIDSWRIFCRDVLRGVADDYNGFKQGEGSLKDFEPEWKRVLPRDKELRACLRWMWLREGFIWDPLTGGKRDATPEEREMAVKGQMQFEDESEMKFAARAAAAVDVRSETARRVDVEAQMAD